MEDNNTLDLDELLQQDPKEGQAEIALQALEQDPVIASILRDRERATLLAELLGTIVMPANRPHMPAALVEYAWRVLEVAGYLEGDTPAIDKEAIEAKAEQAMVEAPASREGLVMFLAMLYPKACRRAETDSTGFAGWVAHEIKTACPEATT